MDAARIIRARAELGVIVSKLNAEHYAIEGALYALDGAAFVGASSCSLAQIMDAVLDLCLAHFASEEEAFRDFSYPDAGANAMSHQNLLKRIRAIRMAVSEGRLDTVWIARDLLEILGEHRSRFDRRGHVHLLGYGVELRAGEAVRTDIDRTPPYRAKKATCGGG